MQTLSANKGITTTNQNQMNRIKRSDLSKQYKKDQSFLKNTKSRSKETINIYKTIDISDQNL